MASAHSPRWCDVCDAYGDHHTDGHLTASLDDVVRRAVLAYEQAGRCYVLGCHGPSFTTAADRLRAVARRIDRIGSMGHDDVVDALFDIAQLVADEA